MKDGSVTTIPLRDLEDTVRTGCHHCTDLTAQFSDISAGSVGSPDGYTTIIIRSEQGKAFFESARKAGKLAVENRVDLETIEKLAALKGRRAPTPG
jgi:coenzyme F420 hydrogenase subunit beta